MIIQDNFKTLASFCQSYRYLKMRIAFLSFCNKKYSDWMEKILLLLEYLQLMSQTILLHSQNYKISNQLGFSTVIYFFKLVNPSYMLPFNTSDILTPIILLVIFCFSILKSLLFFYIVCIAFWNFKGSTVLINLWKWVFKAQARIICFFITSFWLKAILSISTGNFYVKGIDNLVIYLVFGILIGMEYLFSFFIEMQFSYVLPGKNFLSSKGCQLQISTLTQKLVIQILQTIFKETSISSLWVFHSLNLIFSIIRSHHFFTIFPLYKFDALLYQGDLLSIAISLNLSCFFQTLLRTVNYSDAQDIDLIIILWAVFSLFTVKVSRQFLRKTMISLLIGKTSGPPELLLHKVNATKQLRRLETKPGKHSEQYHLTYLLKMTEIANFKNVFDLTQASLGNLQLDMNSKKNFNTIFLKYLENLHEKFPKNSLIKLHLAHHCSKHSELQTKAIIIAAGLNQSSWYTNNLNTYFLLHKVEKTILTQNKGNRTNLDVTTLIKSLTFIEELKKDIIQQIELRITVCNNIVKEKSNIGEIFNCAQIIHESKSKISQKINMFPNSIPESYIEPLLICAQYYLVLNYSIEDYTKYNDLYAKRYLKHEKWFLDTKLSNENLHQNTNTLLLLSAQKLDYGRIVFATDNIENICGGDKSSYYGAHISSIFSPSLQLFYSHLFKQVFEANNSSLLNNTRRTFLYHKDRYIVEAEFYIRIHPYIIQNLYLLMVIRPIPSKKEYILLKENGDIEGATKTIADTLGIYSSSKSSFLPTINIKALSRELHLFTENLNLPSRDQSAEKIIKVNNKDQKEHAHSIMRKFTFFNDYRTFDLNTVNGSSSQIIELKPIRSTLTQLNDRGNSYFYQCSILSYGLMVLKEIMLEEVLIDDDQEHQNRFNWRKREDLTIRGLRVEELVDEEEKDNEDSKPGSENIDYCEIENGAEKVYHWKGENNLLTDDNLLSPESNGGFLTTKRLIATPVKRLATISNSVVTIESHKSKQDQIHIKRRKTRRYFTNQSSQDSNEKIMHTTFKKAITTKSYPKSFNILCFVFYAVILITFISQITLKITSDDTMQDFILKKELLAYAQFRSFKLVQMQIVARGASLLIAGALTKGDLGGAGSGVVETVGFINDHRINISLSNKAIIDGIESLNDKEIKEKLFQKDVRIYGSYFDSLDGRYENVTNFQAVGKLINAADTLVALSNPVSTQGYQAFNFMTINILDDLSAKNTEIMNLFLDSVNMQREYFQNMIVFCLIISPLLLLGVGLVFTLILLNQYRIERDLMLAFIKMNPTGVQKTLNNLKQFKRKLLTANKQTTDITYNLITLSKEERIGGYQKKNHYNVKFSDTKRRYYGYTIRVLMYFSVLIGIITWNYLSALSSTSIIYKRQTQLEFANYISTRVSMSYAAFVELFASNNTLSIEHLDPQTAMINGISEVKNIQGKVAEVFMEDDKTYDPKMQALVYVNDDHCARYWHLELVYCSLLTGKGFRNDLMSLVINFETLMRSKLQDYYEANKTLASQILSAAYINIGNILPTFSLISYRAQLISDLIDEKLTNSISNAQLQRNLILILFSISLVVISLLIWYKILTKLREVHNDFKKVLQVFPAKLILSNSFMKTFLQRTSREFKNINFVENSSPRETYMTELN